MYQLNYLFESLIKGQIGVVLNKSYVCKKDQMLMYAVTDSRWSTENYTLEMQIEDALKGGVTFLQLREKNMNTEELAALGRKVKTICDRYNVPLVINDNIEAAILCQADGVHVGQNDLSPDKVREIMGENAIVGVTVKTVEQAKKAEAQGASYVGSGAMFETGTKKDTYVISRDTIRDICHSISIPVVAIGGIDENNVLELKGTGIDGVAVVSAIFGKKDIYMAAIELRKKIEKIV